MTQRITYPIPVGGPRSISVDHHPRLGTAIHSRGQKSISVDAHPRIWIGMQTPSHGGHHDHNLLRSGDAEWIIHQPYIPDWKNAVLPYRSELGSGRIGRHKGGFK